MSLIIRNSILILFNSPIRNAIEFGHKNSTSIQLNLLIRKAIEFGHKKLNTVSIEFTH
ncbi:hypothetical protein ANAPC5_01257 [Anaplasma phagocytophilum]|nr:hypothetical protein ANAPC5_01257 [Anaplasma phagocytophilum]